jgi:hypothetical protein
MLDGEVRYFSATYARLAAVPGQPHHLHGMGRDRTEEVRALRVAERSRRVGPDDGRPPRNDHHLLQALLAIQNAGRDGAGRLLRTATDRVRTGLDADGVSLTRCDGELLVPLQSVSATRTLRWREVPLDRAGVLATAIERDRVAWLHAGTSCSRHEVGLLRRLVARTLCCVPLTVEGRRVGALLIRWSLGEHQPTLAETTFVLLVKSTLESALAPARPARTAMSA